MPPLCLWYTASMLLDELDARISALEDLVDAQEIRIRQQNRDLDAVKQYLRIASKYTNANSDTLIAGIQAALGKAAESNGRVQRTKGKKR